MESEEGPQDEPTIHLAVQYAMLDYERLQYRYYLQGYIENGVPMVDYVVNDW